MKLLMLLAPGFEELEALGTADILKRLGVDVRLVGLDSGTIEGAHGITIETDEIFTPNTSCDGVILPGGLPGATNLLADGNLIVLIQKLHAQGKLTAAICAAPIVFAKAGILQDNKFTMYPGFERYLGNLHYTADLAVTDGSVITGKGPGAVFAFAGEIAKFLGLAEKLPELFAGMFVQ